MIDIKDTGLDTVLGKFAAMENRERKKALRKSVRAGRKDMLAEVKSRAARLEKEGTGMAETIAAAAKIRPLKARTLRRIGVRSGYGMYIWFDTQRFPQLVHYPGGSYSYTAERQTRRGTKIVRKTHGQQSFIPAAIEYGHAGPGNFGGAKVTAAKPFVRPAHEATKSKSVNQFRKKMVTELKRYWDSPRV